MRELMSFRSSTAKERSWQPARNAFRRIGRRAPVDHRRDGLAEASWSSKTRIVQSRRTPSSRSRLIATGLAEKTFAPRGGVSSRDGPNESQTSSCQGGQAAMRPPRLPRGLGRIGGNDLERDFRIRDSDQATARAKSRVGSAPRRRDARKGFETLSRRDQARPRGCRRVLSSAVTFSDAAPSERARGARDELIMFVKSALPSRSVPPTLITERRQGCGPGIAARSIIDAHIHRRAPSPELHRDSIVRREIDETKQARPHGRSLGRDRETNSARQAFEWRFRLASRLTSSPPKPFMKRQPDHCSERLENPALGPCSLRSRQALSDGVSTAFPKASSVRSGRHRFLARVAENTALVPVSTGHWDTARSSI